MVMLNRNITDQPDMSVFTRTGDAVQEVVIGAFIDTDGAVAVRIDHPHGMPPAFRVTVGGDTVFERKPTISEIADMIDPSSAVLAIARIAQSLGSAHEWNGAQQLSIIDDIITATLPDTLPSISDQTSDFWEDVE